MDVEEVVMAQEEEIVVVIAQEVVATTWDMEAIADNFSETDLELSVLSMNVDVL